MIQGNQEPLIDRLLGPLLWVAVGLAVVLFCSYLYPPLARFIGATRDSLAGLRRALLASSRGYVGPRVVTFWRSRRAEPVRPLLAGLQRLSDSLPDLGQITSGKLLALRQKLADDLVVLGQLGFHPDPPAANAGAREAAKPRANGSLGGVILLLCLALVVGGVNAFLLSEFFQGVGLSERPLPYVVPDLTYGHILAVLIFLLEIANGFLFHYVGKHKSSDNAKQRLMGLAPWVGLVAFATLELLAYALLSQRIQLPQRLQIAPDSPFHGIVNNFLAGLGVALTLILSALGYYLGLAVDALAETRKLKAERKRLDAFARSVKSSQDQLAKTKAGVEELSRTAQGFDLGLIDECRKRFDSEANGVEAGGILAGTVTSLVTAVQNADEDQAPLGNDTGTAGRLSYVRTRNQVLSDLILFAGALILLMAVGWISIGYFHAYFTRTRTDGLTLSTAAAFAVALTLFPVIVSYVARELFLGGRYGSVAHSYTSGSSKRARAWIGVGLATLGLLCASVYVAVAVKNRTLGSNAFNNGLFGLFHASLLGFLGTALDAAVVNGAHLVVLAAFALLMGMTYLVATGILGLEALLSILLWTVGVLAVIGGLFRPKAQPDPSPVALGSVPGAMHKVNVVNPSRPAPDSSTRSGASYGPEEGR